MKEVLSFVALLLVAISVVALIDYIMYHSNEKLDKFMARIKERSEEESFDIYSKEVKTVNADEICQNPEDFHCDERLKYLKEYTWLLDSYKNLGMISTDEYEKERNYILSNVDFIEDIIIHA